MRFLAVFTLVASGITVMLTGCKREDDVKGKSSSGHVKAPSKQKKTDSQPNPSQVPPSPEKDPKLDEFHASIKTFIKEGRSLTRAMQLLPSRASYKKRVETVEEKYSRIPDPPPGNKTLGMCYKSARQITVNFGVGNLYLKFIDDFLRLNSKAGADKSAKQFRELGKKQREDLDELEAALNEGRIPKIELSDVIKGTE